MGIGNLFHYFKSKVEVEEVPNCAPPISSFESKVNVTKIKKYTGSPSTGDCSAHHATQIDEDDSDDLLNLISTVVEVASLSDSGSGGSDCSGGSGFDGGGGSSGGGGASGDY